MPKNEALLASEYKNFIREAYIDPIRTVVVVDDDFPSLDGLIRWETNKLTDEQNNENENENETIPWKSKDIESVSKILDVCRKPDRHWIVDIHDAHNISIENEKTFAPHLHQSDLMILDYHLEGNDGDGTKAIELLRLLKESDHFNLVIVYTQGYPKAGGDIGRVIREIALGLMTPDLQLNLHETPSKKILKALQEWEDEMPEIVARLREEIDEGAYLAIRAQSKPDFKQAKSFPEFQSVLALLEEKPPELLLNDNLLLQWLISEKQKELTGKLHNGKDQNVSFQQNDNGGNWIRTERLFVTVVSKEYEPAQLPDKLIEALYEWRPHPHRLIMSKMRAELSERGVLAEERILGDHFLEIGWLRGLLAQDQDDRVWKIRSLIGNHWDSLGDGIQGNVEKFASVLAENLCNREFKEIAETFRLLDPKANHAEITKHINAFNCSKAIEGYHLTTGHVLETISGSGKEYWLCLTPACDLVPGQKNDRGWKKRLGENMPFKAVRLFPAEINEALSNATMNSHIFLNINQSISVFSFTPTGESASNPAWEQMFSKNQGKFSHPDLTLSIGRVVSQDGVLKVNDSNFSVISQLRYEYALNLLQRLGGALSRIGLDFQNVDTQKTNKDG
ncbi:MAG: response regulator receiver domain [Desulfosalsimonadaceae bacterium]